MIDLQDLKRFYAPKISASPRFERHILKEYIELLALDFLSAQSAFAAKMCFIGGTNLRLVKGINRFSEDLDFDCRELSASEFELLTDALAEALRQNGLNVELKARESEKLIAFRRSLYFPSLLFDLRLSGHREEKFLMKVEAQDQGVDYETRLADIDRCGFHIQVPVPPDDVLLSMKLAALLARGKGRDFYDAMFLMQMTEPSYGFLSSRCGISSQADLLRALREKVADTDLQMKMRDFRHLLFDERDAARILDFGEFAERKLA